MNIDRKKRDAAIAIALSLAIALPGTFAWQSISQQALNEMVSPNNPGGRLHDDFSGWQPGDTKDIYVENFGGKIIYARIRLDEYMEIGEGAGKKGADAVKDVKIVGSLYNPRADINDVTTWTTHIPGDSPEIERPPAAPDPPPDPDDPRGRGFHDYWTWTMGGHAADNVDGKTVYMPTFNKNKDSLSADINGTLEGTNPGDSIYYDDYHKYVLGETADRVRDETKTTTIKDGKEEEVYLVPSGAFYDGDENTVDEMTRDKTHPMYGYDIYGNGGAVNVNYQVNEETHTAKETQSGTVMLMADWEKLTGEEKKNTYAWVYDVDGWAYWSQPIDPGTATGLLLDRIELKNEMNEVWYYGINAVAQFITADSLGREDNTGFYSPEGAPPTADALELLDFIGVQIDTVEAGRLSIEAFNEEGIPVNAVRSGQAVYLTLDGTGAVSLYLADAGQSDSWIWTLEKNTSVDTYLTDEGLLIVGPDESASYLLITVQSGVDENIKGALALRVEDGAAEGALYTAIIKAEQDQSMVVPGGNLTLYGVIEGEGEAVFLDADFIWTLDSTERTYAEGTVLIPNSGTAILNVGPEESGVITVAATARNTEAFPGASATFFVTVADPENPGDAEMPPPEEGPVETDLPVESGQPPELTPPGSDASESPPPAGPEPGETDLPPAAASPEPSEEDLPPAAASPEPSETGPPSAETPSKPDGWLASPSKPPAPEPSEAAPPPAEPVPEPSEAAPPPAEPAPEPGEAAPQSAETFTRPGTLLSTPATSALE